MTTALQNVSTSTALLSSLDEQTMAALVAGGDCSRLSPAQRTAYYIARCEAAGLDPRAQPFAYTNLSGKLVLYALKSASDQLTALHGISTTILSQGTESGIRLVTARATSKSGRSQEDIGAVNVEGLKGEALCNAMMKAVTKAKRRTVLSLCGLGGVMDETELETVKGAQPLPPPTVEELQPAEPPKSSRTTGPRPIAAVVEAMKPPAQAETPAKALWMRARAKWGDAAAVAFKNAVNKAGVPHETPSDKWTFEQVALVEAALFPAEDDIQF